MEFSIRAMLFGLLAFGGVVVYMIGGSSSTIHSDDHTDYTSAVMDLEIGDLIHIEAMDLPAPMHSHDGSAQLYMVHALDGGSVSLHHPIGGYAGTFNRASLVDSHPLVTKLNAEEYAAVLGGYVNGEYQRRRARK